MAVYPDNINIAQTLLNQQATINEQQAKIKRLQAENDRLRAALGAIRDYLENPEAVNAENMTLSEKISGMWSQAVAGLDRQALEGER